MSVDTSRLRGGGLRRLGPPPTDGAPGIERAPASTLLQHEQATDPVPENPPLSTREPTSLQTAITRPTSDDKQNEPADPLLEGVRRRVPPPETEPRIPFTTRVALSTKERLEDACYHLRVKHQVFIDEAIRLHLKRNGF